MLRIGLTGSMATGKTTVLNQCADMGVPTYSADEAVHELYRGEAVPMVEAMFPGTVRDGEVDRQALGAQLAENPERISELETLIHPLVREKALEFLEQAQARGAAISVVEIPLLYETGAHYPLDCIIVTHCSDEIQRERALKRPGMNPERLDMLLSRQMSQEEKKQRGDFLVDTSGTIEQTRARTQQIIKELWVEPEKCE